MRISDWSSDVCSSDLSDEAPTRGIRAEMQAPARRTAPVAPPDRPALARDCARPVACGIGSRTKPIRTRDRQMATQLKRNRKYSEAEWTQRQELAACYRILAMMGWDELLFNNTK